MSKILNNISLKDHISFKLDGTARYFMPARSRQDMIRGVRWAQENNVPCMVLGSASNVVPGKDTYPGLIIQNSWSQIEHDHTRNVVCVSSGTELSTAVNYYLDAGLGGLEWAGGLPGTVGGAVRGNAGAFGGEIKDLVRQVVSLRYAVQGAEMITRSNPECSFAYRESIFKHNNEMILTIELGYTQADKNLLKKTINDCINYRKERLPLEYPSAGSFFKNIPVESVSREIKKQFEGVIKNDPIPLIPTAAIIAELGLKGKQIGGAQISEKHPNFIINKSEATYADIIALVSLVETSVYQKYGIRLEREVQVI